MFLLLNKEMHYSVYLILNGPPTLSWAKGGGWEAELGGRWCLKNLDVFSLRANLFYLLMFVLSCCVTISAPPSFRHYSLSCRTGDPTVSLVHLSRLQRTTWKSHISLGDRNAWLSFVLCSGINRACLITSIGHINNVAIIVVKSGTWEVEGSRATDLGTELLIHM